MTRMKPGFLFAPRALVPSDMLVSAMQKSLLLDGGKRSRGKRRRNQSEKKKKKKKKKKEAQSAAGGRILAVRDLLVNLDQW